MKLLAFDTSTAQGSVAIVEGDRVLAERKWRRAQSHSEFLTAEIAEALKDAALEMRDLDALAVGQGPGSFTGIRVAINAARALGYTLKTPVYVADTSAILSQDPAIAARLSTADGNSQKLDTLTVINAQKNSFFVSRFNSKGERTLDLQAMTLDQLKEQLTIPVLAVGDGCSIVEPLLNPKWIRDESVSDYPLATSLARIAISSPAAKVWNEVQPLYIRASGAEEKMRGE